VRSNSVKIPEGISSPTRKRRRFQPVLLLSLVVLSLFASPGLAQAQTWCWKGGENVRSGDTSRTRVKQQAAKTWEDWVWRGSTFRCPTNVPQCTYAWGQSKTTGWSYTTGVSIDLAGLKLPGSLSAEFQRRGETTTSFTYTVFLRPGQYAQPVQKVVRRWQSGDFVGAFRTNGRTCSISSWDNGREYYWDARYAWGNWSRNVRVNDFGTYHVWK
jgi:hypothetical protein